MAAGQVEENRRRENTLQLEKERMTIVEHLGMGYIGALVNIGNGLQSLAALAITHHDNK